MSDLHEHSEPTYRTADGEIRPSHAHLDFSVRPNAFEEQPGSEILKYRTPDELRAAYDAGVLERTPTTHTHNPVDTNQDNTEEHSVPTN